MNQATFCTSSEREKFGHRGKRRRASREWYETGGTASAGGWCQRQRRRWGAHDQRRLVKLLQFQVILVFSCNVLLEHGSFDQPINPFDLLISDNSQFFTHFNLY